MITLIENQDHLDAFIADSGDYNPDVNYMSQDRKNGECFGICGCTYASEAFGCIDSKYRLIISDDKNHQKQIEEQINSEFPELNGFYLN